MKTQPSENETETAPALAAKALDSELNLKGSASAPAVVNDLTSIVKKKKKPAPAADAGAAAGNGKRKADDSEEVGNNEKKARLEDEMQT